jgi:hypothetical protein
VTAVWVTENRRSVTSKAGGRLDRRLVSDVRVIERQIGRIDRDVGLG